MGQGSAASCATSSFLSTCKKQGMIASATSGWYHRAATRNLHPLLTPDSSLATTLFFSLFQILANICAQNLLSLFPTVPLVLCVPAASEILGDFVLLGLLRLIPAMIV